MNQAETSIDFSCAAIASRVKDKHTADHSGLTRCLEVEENVKRFKICEKASMKGKSILLVDDEKLILSSFSRELASEDWEVTVAASGESAVAQINNGHFDLVITDLLLPGIDGFQVLKASKMRDAQTMVIIMTGYADLDSAVDALRLGADDFLQKPCDIDELLCRISQCFAKQDRNKRKPPRDTLVTTCCYCKKIRDDCRIAHGKENWYGMEEYLSKVQGANVSHGCCSDCFAEQMKKLHRD